MKEMVGGCCVCSDDRGWPENPLVYCDGQSCTVAVHQACYGIVTVPTGPWYCRKCESQERSAKVKCELCPSKYGALKRTDNSGWAHVVCALYIPEVRFGNVTTMEPIQLQLIPQERFSKVCYICQENGKPASASVGACMQCNRSGCKQQFHVTCAQSLGLLCEEAGNYLDNVKYCGYCQHHYSKLKKGGNVKTIPPYKPVASENLQSDSSSDKDPLADPALKPTTVSAPLGKRKAAANNKAISKANVKAPAYQKQVVKTAGEKSSTKTAASVKSAKSADDSTTVSAPPPPPPPPPAESEKVEKKESEVVVEKEVPTPKDSSGKGKKRKANSRTPTPNITSENNSSATVVSDSAPVNSAVTRKDSSPVAEPVDKPKKVKTDNLPQTPSPRTTRSSPLPTTATTTAIPVTASNTTTATTAQEPTAVVTTSTTTTATSSIIQPTPPINSVVVSVPLLNTSLSPRNNNVSNHISPHPNVPATALPTPPLVEESNKDKTPVELVSSSPSVDDINDMITSELSGGGLKITFEKQPGAAMPLDLEDVIPAHVDIPTKRSRSKSVEKIEKTTTRSKKKNANGLVNSANTSKRSSRSQHNTPPPQQSTTFVNMPQSSQIKDSPPSSPSSESLGGPPNLGRKKGRKSAPASVSASNSNSNSKDSKDNIKLFQNGINAPHMLGNQLNLNSKMAQNMSDHLNSEMEAHSIFTSGENSSSLVGPQLHHRVIASARSSSAGGSSTASGGSGLSSMLGGNGGAIPQTLDQLLERQWEQGSQFLMEQAQHFDIASLLSCLHQLRAENLRLEEHVSSLLQRRDHLLAVNARLAIPLTGPPATPQSAHPHTVNNIHPAVATSHTEAPRARHGNAYPSHAQTPQHPTGSMENGISPEQAGYPNPHRSPAGTQPQPSPNIRQSGGYPSSGLLRQTTESSGGRSAPRSHNYSLYQGPPNAQQQMAVRRDSDQQQQPPHSSQSKPS